MPGIFYLADMLLDNHGRSLNYVRLAVTDRCNLRCFYCMPAEGIDYVPRAELLTYEEMLRLLDILSKMGISKVRITGGEPFVRKGLPEFLEKVRDLPGIESIHITTNGVLTKAYIPLLKRLEINSINLSLDTLDPDNFFKITRRNEFAKVLDCLYALLDAGIDTKVNAVVMDGKNTDDILPFTQFTEKNKVAIRFIEEMPFNGSGGNGVRLKWNHKQIMDTIRTVYPNLEKLEDGPSSTSFNYRVPGFAGSVGVIPAFSRTFCGSCNRIRITPKGDIKTCLYDEGVYNMRDLIRKEAKDEVIQEKFLQLFQHRAKDGFEAQSKRAQNGKVHESMSSIGG